MYTITELVMIFVVGIYAGYMISELRKSTAFNRCVSLIIDLRQKIERQAQRIEELEDMLAGIEIQMEDDDQALAIHLVLTNTTPRQETKK